ncbi:MAG: HlyC/CorC family transporter [Bryobacterales bacterium]|nr:HlyC/CorC family transporter [Bryobacterales bacterium]
MADVSFTLRFVLLAFILASNAFFAGAEVGLLTVRGSRLRQLAADGNKGAVAALQLLDNPERLLSVVQVGVTLSSLGLGWAGEDSIFLLFTQWFAPALDYVSEPVLRGLAFFLAFSTMTFAHVVLGEVVPKNLAIERADRIATVVAPVLLVFYRISEPFVRAIERTSLFVSKVLGLRGEASGGHSAEELKVVVSLSRGSGLLPERQEDMIHNVLDFDKLLVREVMVPRHEIVSVPRTASLDDLLRTMIREQHSRLPVYEGSPENIVGVLYAKDLPVVWAERRATMAAGRRPPEFRVDHIMRRLIVVPETKPLTQLLEQFRNGAHMAMVVDEFGTIVGLVTVEDVLEQIVGEIEDEYDAQPFEAPLADASYLELEGTINIRDLEMRYGIEIPVDAGFETLAGFLLQRFGCIPEAGANAEYEGRRYTVLEMERNRIARVKIEKLEPEEAGASE